jgi:hypothetical protein
MERHVVLIVIGVVIVLVGLVLFAMGFIANDPSMNAIETVKIPDPGGSERVTLEKRTYEVWIEVTEESGFIGDVGLETVDGYFLWEGASDGHIETIGEVQNIGDFKIDDPGIYRIYSNDGVKIYLTDPNGGSSSITIAGIVLAIIGAVVLVVGIVMRPRGGRTTASASRNFDAAPGEGWQQPKTPPSY